MHHSPHTAMATSQRISRLRMLELNRRRQSKMIEHLARPSERRKRISLARTDCDMFSGQTQGARVDRPGTYLSNNVGIRGVDICKRPPQAM